MSPARAVLGLVHPAPARTPLQKSLPADAIQASHAQHIPLVVTGLRPAGPTVWAVLPPHRGKRTQHPSPIAPTATATAPRPQNRRVQHGPTTIQPPGELSQLIGSETHALGCLRCLCRTGGDRGTRWGLSYPGRRPPSTFRGGGRGESIRQPAPQYPAAWVVTTRA